MLFIISPPTKLMVAECVHLAVFVLH